MHKLVIFVSFLAIVYGKDLESLPTHMARWGQNDGPELKATLLETTLLGVEMNSRNGRPIFGYKGIPYTNGPPERFKIAVVAKPFGVFKKTFDATEFGEVCLQRNSQITDEMEVIGDEDCLFLNVYTPLEKPSETDSLPVMVYFHGGNFVRGSSYMYQPSYLLNEDVILVTIHYRLGALSFFTVGDQRTPGNLALHDQKVALKWVQKYITDFGGDPNNVTIFGQGAGSISVHYHVLSDNSQKFHGAIAQSGSALDVMAFDEIPLVTSLQLANVTPKCDSVLQGSDTPTKNDIYGCMTKANTEDLALAYDILFESYNVSLPYPFAAPSIESWTLKAIVKESPYDAIQNPDLKTVPMILGTVAQEGSVIFGKMYSEYLGPSGKADDESYVELEMIEDLIEFTFRGLSNQKKIISDSLKQIYFSYTTDVDFLSYCSGMTDLVGALFVKSSTLSSATEYAKLNMESRANVYLYSFEYKGSNTTFNDHFIGEDYPPVCDSGVSPSDDLFYLFDLDTKEDEEEISLTEKMVTLWTLFAKYKDPTPSVDPKWNDLNIPSWKTFDPLTSSYLVMDKEFASKEGYESMYTQTGDAEKITTTTEKPAPPDYGEFLSLYDDLMDERDAYMVTMIVFIILFIVASAAAIFLFLKSRR